MAIVKMKRLQLLALRPDREALLRRLQSLGCVEIREPDIDLSDPEWAGLGKPGLSDLETAREQSLLLGNALDVLRRYAPAKDSLFAPRPELTEGELFSEAVYAQGLDAARQVMEDFVRINREMGISILLNIHHVELALEYASRVIGIRAGEIVYDGPASQVDQAVLDEIYRENASGEGQP